jgi:hypothetical protein
VKMNLKAVGAWMMQGTSITGTATLAFDAAAYFQHQIGLGMALSTAAGAIVLIAMPQRADVQKEVAVVAEDAVATVASKGLGAAPLALTSDLITLAGMLDPKTQVVAVQHTITPIAPAAAAQNAAPPALVAPMVPVAPLPAPAPAPAAAPTVMAAMPLQQPAPQPVAAAPV